MSRPLKVFLWIFGISLGLGLLLGLANLVAPDAVSVSLNDENVEGVSSLWVALMSGGIPGLIIGLIGAGVTALFFNRKKSG
jgi:hypothetical protein